MSRIRPLLVALAVIATVSIASAPAAHAIKAREAMVRAGSHCEIDLFIEDGRVGVMITCGTWPDLTVIFCKGDDDCYISRAPVQTPPTTRKPGQGVAVADAQQTPALDIRTSPPARLPKETVLAYVARIGSSKLTADDRVVRNALQLKALVAKPSKAK